MPSPASSKPPARSLSVFINCPFDPDYRPLFRAMCFTIAACGYVPRCALDFSDSGVVRFEKILDLIAGSDLSIHDVSRVELDTSTGLPRFNMPLELGADLGLRLRGPKAQRERRNLVLDTKAHRYDVTLSDISGMDVEAHGGDPDRVITLVRNWLNQGRPTPLPGGAAIASDYRAFLALVPDIVRSLRLDEFDDLPHPDFMYVVEYALVQIEAARTGA